MVRLLPFGSGSRANSYLGAETLSLWMQSTLSWTIIGVLLGRAAIFGEIWPLGLAFVAAWRVLSRESKAVVPILAVALSLVSAVGFRLSLPYLAAFSLLWFIPAHNKKMGRYWLLCSSLIVKVLLHYLLEPVPMVFVIGITESILALFSYELLHLTLQHCLEEQLACGEIKLTLFALAIIVAVNFSWGGFSPRLFFIFLLVALAARVGGLRVSCILGPALALLILLLGESTQISLLIIIASLLTGFLHDFRWGYYVGPLLALVFTIPGPADVETVQLIFLLIAASWLALRVSHSNLELLARVIPGTKSFMQQNHAYTQHIKEVFDQRIDQYLTVFKELEHNLLDNENPLFHTQMHGMAELLLTMKNAFSPELHFTKELEELLLNHFVKEDLAHITVLKSLDGFEVHGARQERCGTGLFCRQVAGFCSGTIESRNFGVVSRGCSNGGVCQFKIVPQPEYKLEIGRAKLASQEVSGDSQVTFEIIPSKVAVALSDGMGIGVKAKTESNIAVRLLERLIKAGYELSVAVSLVNRLLILRNQDEMFVTIDLVVVDLFSGQLEFVKIGAAPSFIKRGQEVEIIQNHTLPAGILSQVEVQSDRRTLKEGEVLVMATDGVLDAQRSIARKDEWMCWNLRRLHDGQDLASMAEAILAESLAVANGRVDDDMMVVVARLVKQDQDLESYRSVRKSV